MLLCFGALFFIGMTPLWLVALVVARDLAIACGWLVIKLSSLSIATQPLVVGKRSGSMTIAGRTFTISQPN